MINKTLNWFLDLVHRYSLEISKNHRELQYLGDAVLELVAREHVLNYNPRIPFNEVNFCVGALVGNKGLQQIGLKLNIGSRVGESGYKSIANFLELRIALLYKFGGLGVARWFIKNKLFVHHDMRSILAGVRSVTKSKQKAVTKIDNDEPEVRKAKLPREALWAPEQPHM